MRREKNLATNVIILSARHEVDDKITGLNLGADDYLTKPFSFSELLARLRSLVRRHAGQKRTMLEHRGIHLDLLTREVTFDGRALQLTPNCRRTSLALAPASTRFNAYTTCSLLYRFPFI